MSLCLMASCDSDQSIACVVDERFTTDESAGDVIRKQKVTVKGWDFKGNEVTIEASDFLARIFQHEIDHLNGKLFVDHISPLKRTRIRAKMDKKHKAEAR